jgi:hypothetical protein
LDTGLFQALKKFPASHDLFLSHGPMGKKDKQYRVCGRLFGCRDRRQEYGFCVSPNEPLQRFWDVVALAWPLCEHAPYKFRKYSELAFYGFFVSLSIEIVLAANVDF